MSAITRAGIAGCYMNNRGRDQKKKTSRYSHSRRRFSNSSKGPERTVVVGGGELGSSVVLKALERGNYVCLHANQPGNLGIALMKEDPTGKRFEFIPTTYSEGKDPLYWAEKLEGHLSDRQIRVRVVNARGVSVLPKNERSFHEANTIPAIALTAGLIAAKEKAPRTQCGLVNLSSSVAAVPGFAEKNVYAKSRKDADTAIEQLAQANNLPGYTLQCDYVVQPRTETSIIGANHGASFDHLSASFFHPIIGDPDSVVAFQPVCQEQVTNAILSQNLYEQSYLTIVAAGPVTFTQREIYQFYANLLNKSLRIVPVPRSMAEWAGKHVSYAQISYGTALLLHRLDCPVANKPFEVANFGEFVGNDLKTLHAIYANQQDALLQVRSPVRVLTGKAVEAIRRSPEAGKDLIRVLPDIPTLLLNVAKVTAFPTAE